MSTSKLSCSLAEAVLPVGIWWLVLQEPATVTKIATAIAFSISVTLLVNLPMNLILSSVNLGGITATSLKLLNFML